MADARRLAACWNACELMPTEQVEKVSPSWWAALSSVPSILEAIEDERDQLQADLGEAVDSVAQLQGQVDQLRAELVDARASVELMRAAMTGAAERPKTALKGVEGGARMMVSLAEAAGLVLTITQRPLLPLAMGNYETVVEVRPARVMAEKGGA